MDLFDPKEVSDIAHLNKFGGELVAKVLMQVLKLNKINKEYQKYSELSGIEFIDSVIDRLEIKYDISEKELARIPKEGAFLSVSNHPYGGIDGIILIKLLSEVRDDFKIMANFLLQRVDPIKDYFLSVNPFETHKEASSSLQGLKLALNHLAEGHPLSMFPAGEVSTYHSGNKIRDRKWQYSALKFIKRAKVPVVPIYFQGTNSKIFHLLGRIHPLLRTAKLPSELFNKKNKIIKVRVGHPISVKEQDKFPEIEQYGRFLRAKTYALGTSLEVKHFLKQIRIQRTKRVEPVINPVPVEEIEKEFEKIKNEFLLFNIQNFEVYCAPSTEIPNILKELGRLREITFREVGEGTNRNIDLDEYDLYYNHLTIWDKEAKKIVGAYRVGMGKDILTEYGLKGFYIQSLFKIRKDFMPYLEESIELGRSFVVSEYQRKPLSLFLLWKGLLYFLLKHPEYRYLIGPVSISNEFSKFSKTLIVEFSKKYFFWTDMAKYIKPKKRFTFKEDKNIDHELFLKNTERDINRLDNFIKDIENELRTPVLLKKYIKMNAKIIAFNIDPKFNNCLDGLIMLDIFDVPQNFLKSLSKEVNDEAIVGRFNF